MLTSISLKEKSTSFWKDWWALKTTGSFRIILAEENTLNIGVPLEWRFRQEMIRSQTRRSVSSVSEYSVLTNVLVQNSVWRLFRLRWGASYDNLLPGIKPRCLAVWAGFTMLLSPVISLKWLADIQLDMSASQAEKQTCLSEEERMMEKYTSVGTVEDKRKCGTEKGVEWIRGRGRNRRKPWGISKKGFKWRHRPATEMWFEWSDGQSGEKSERAASGSCCVTVSKADLKVLKGPAGKRLSQCGGPHRQHAMPSEDRPPPSLWSVTNSVRD